MRDETLDSAPTVDVEIGTRVRHLRAACLLAGVAARLPLPRAARLRLAAAAVALVRLEIRVADGPWRTLHVLRPTIGVR